MLATLKIVHLLCLLAGGAAGIGNTILLRHAALSGAPPPPVMAGAMAALGRIGMVAIGLLWISGLWMLWAGIGVPSGAAGWAFWFKLLAATVVLGAVSGMAMLRARAEREGGKPDPAKLRPLMMASLGGVVLAVALAVLAFG